MLDNEFKKSATEKVTAMSANEYKEAFKAIGSKPLTNEEWIKQCNTEQLAEVIGNIAKNAYQCGQNGKTNKCVNRNHCTGYCDYGWEMWLKQPHHSVTNCNE